jgi:UDP:flavonoid glycosyltransferase YjiC (YdhE family)
MNEGEGLRIAVCTTGTGGDHRPYLAIALELRRQGHDVACVVHPKYSNTVEQLRLPAHIAGTDWPDSYLVAHPEMLDPRRGFYEITRQLLLPDASLQFEQLERLHATRRIEAVVAHHIAFGAIWWAEARDVPLTLGWLSPAAIIRPDGHGSMLPGVARRTPKLISQLLRLLVPPIVRRELDAPMNAARTALGLRHERDSMIRLLTSEHGHVALWSEALRSPAAGDPPGLVTCGFPFFETEADARPIPADTAKFLEEDPPPIVCALGTTGGDMPFPVADLVAEGCERSGRRALLIGDRPPTSAGSSRWVAFAPHARVFENAQLIVHHAGIGTLAAVLRAGKPSLVLPLANDQFDNGVRLKGRGVASILDVRKATPAAIGRALRKLIEDRSAARETSRLGARVRAENGARLAAETIVAYAYSRSSALRHASLGGRASK